VNRYGRFQIAFDNDSPVRYALFMPIFPPQDDTPAGVMASADDLRLIEALRRRDEAAFVALIDRYHTSLLRLARLYVSDRAAAEEVVQDTWLGVLKGIDRFEGRSSLKTWLYRILTNKAKTRGVRDANARSVPFSALWDADAEPFEPAVEPDRFLPPDHPQWPGHWIESVNAWGDHPEERLLSRETRTQIQAAIEQLPPAQHEVIMLRDIEGWSSEEVCNTLGISGTNQRVLLHRARSKVRHALERYLATEQ
jgi:RNA polymerase sigma-70 factor (ECF subfamily)